LGLGILWIVWFKPATKCNPCMWKCIVKPKPRPKTTTEQTLNQCNIGLQVKPDGSEKQTTEKEQGTSSGEIPKRSASPTVFSRPGVIVADHLWQERGRAQHLFRWPFPNPDTVGKKWWAASDDYDFQPL